MTGGPLARPSKTFAVQDYVPKYLAAGQLLDRVAGRAHYKPNDWNTSRPALGLTSTQVGRFDPVPGDDFDFIYAAESCKYSAVAIQETLRGRVNRLPPHNRPVLLLEELKKRILVNLEVSDRLILADLRNPAGLEAFGADEELLGDGDRDVTRLWGQYIRQNTPPEVAGIAYNSTRATANMKAASVVLWRDRVPASFTLLQRGAQDLHDSKGVETVTKAFPGRNLLIL